MSAPLVVDASVLLKWFLPPAHEPDHDRADDLREAHVAGTLALCVPALAVYEVGNTLARLKPAADAAADLEDLSLLSLAVADATPTRTRLTVDLVQRFQVTFYDASYHALAIDLGSTLVTADARYVRRASAAGHIRHLSDWIVH